MDANPNEWVRLPKEGTQLCGLSRSYIRRLIDEKKIVTIKMDPTEKRSVLLINLPSLLKYLTALAIQQNPHLKQPDTES